MKVALVTSIPAGGPVEHAVGLARELRARDVSVRAICATEALAERFQAAGANPAVIPMERALDWRGAGRALRACAGADVVHAHDRRSGLWVRLGPRPKPLGVKVYTAHGLPEPYLPIPGRRPPGLRARLAYRGLDAWLCRRADAVAVPSTAAAMAFAELVGYPERRLVVIRNGVDPWPAREAAGQLVGTLASLEPVKGLDVFLRAAAELATARPELRFAIFGAGPERRALERLARELGISERVSLAGHVPASEALTRLRVFVLSSWMETSGIALLEAMAASVPAVATRVGGIPEAASEGTVQLVAPGDPEALAAAVGRLLDDDALARAQVQSARRRVAQLTTAATAQATLELYERLLSERRCASS
jgi:glycosyltransferase involved in cell wall biosynthesis